MGITISSGTSESMEHKQHVYMKDFQSKHKSSMRDTQEKLEVPIDLKSEGGKSLISGTSGSKLNKFSLNKEIRQESIMQKTHNSLQNQPNLKMSAQMNTVSDHGTEESVSHNLRMGTYIERPQSKHDTEISLNNFSQFQVEGQKPHSCMSESNDSVQMYDEMRLNVVNPAGSSSYTHH